MFCGLLLACVQSQILFSSEILAEVEEVVVLEKSIQKGESIEAGDGLSIAYRKGNHKHRMDGGTDVRFLLEISSNAKSFSVTLGQDDVGEWFVDERYLQVKTPSTEGEKVSVQIGPKSITEVENNIIFPPECGGLNLTSSNQGIITARSQEGCTMLMGQYSGQIILQDFSLSK